jgi:antitoxin MazE
MKVRITRWGKSLAVRIPKHAARGANFREGDCVELSISKGAMVIQKISKHNYTPDELVARITAKNRHCETEWGQPKGNEFC